MAFDADFDDKEHFLIGWTVRARTMTSFPFSNPDDDGHYGTAP